MPPRPYRPDALTWQVFRGSDAVRGGLLTEHQLRSAAWVRLRHDIYADARLERDHTLACRAALLRLPPGVLVGGPSAAHLHGIEHAAAFTEDVHVLVPRQLRVGAQRGLRVHVNASTPISTISPTPRRARWLPRPGAVAVGAGGIVVPDPGHGLRTATAVRPNWASGVPIPRSAPGRAAWETAVWLDPVRAVGIVDSLLGRGLTDRDELAAIAGRNAHQHGGRRARWVFDLADPGAQSPPESHLRVRLVLGGLPRPIARHPVRLPNGVVVHPDLAWREYRVAVEYDGQRQAGRDQPQRDRRTLNLLVGAGWLVLLVTGRRLHSEFPAVLGEVRAALLSRGWRR
ncbi:hypothetical protein O7614_31520 [Micromonospora sp. WMMD961]|uniref:hypothetical protein n=1 Tax=Micromonospora sp. WMMD961 TaxID=3016100 RepID=UPI002417775D|nr:hypothetical protein [Micromonospora sp. WMMD961]MDG4784192.1 hypothetical protein [Micromonospora sp. WMMD961]